MKEQLAALWAKVSNTVVENKELVIRIGCALAGAAVGSVVATAIANAQQDQLVSYETDLYLTESEALANGDVQVTE